MSEAGSVGKVERWVQARGDLYFGRMADGSVLVAQMRRGRPDDKDHEFRSIHAIDDGSWGSLVLTMTAHNERPNDWDEFMAHHHGRKDVLAPAKQATVEAARARARGKK